MLVVFRPTFVAGIKVIYGYNFAALSNKIKSFMSICFAKVIINLLMSGGNKKVTYT